jgi:hypothetical protein
MPGSAIAAAILLSKATARGTQYPPLGSALRPSIAAVILKLNCRLFMRVGYGRLLFGEICLIGKHGKKMGFLCLS